MYQLIMRDAGAQRSPARVDRLPESSQKHPVEARQQARTDLGVDFAAVSAVENRAFEPSGRAAGGFSPMTGETAPSSGVAQMKKGGLYAGGMERRGNIKSAALQRSGQDQRDEMGNAFQQREMDINAQIQNVQRMIGRGSPSPENLAELEQLDQRQRALQAEIDAADGGSMDQFKHLAWNKQDTPEKMRGNLSDIISGAGSLNPYLMTDKHIANNFMSELGVGNMYNGLIGDLRGGDKLGSADPALKKTAGEMRGDLGEEADDIGSYTYFLTNRFNQIQQTGSSKGWEEKILQRKVPAKFNEGIRRSMERMKAQAQQRLAEKGGRKRWMKK